MHGGKGIAAAACDHLVLTSETDQVLSRALRSGTTCIAGVWLARIISPGRLITDAFRAFNQTTMVCEAIDSSRAAGLRIRVAGQPNVLRIQTTPRHSPTDLEAGFAAPPLPRPLHRETWLLLDAVRRSSRRDHLSRS